MASIKRTKSDTFEIRVVIGGQRRSYYPGAKVRTETQASDVADKLDRLAYSCENDELVPKHVIAWVKALPDRQHNRLADWGLVERRKPKRPEAEITLGKWCTAYINRGNRAESTNGQLEDVQRNLVAFFGSDRKITTITEADAEDFRVWLETEAREVPQGKPKAGLAKNTVRRRVGRAREIFNRAVRDKVVAANPFAKETVTVSGNPDRQFFVDASWMERCIAATDCEDWKIMLAFARYAGMRSHETRLQRWSDIDLPNRKMIVRSNKNPPTRVCPIFPELLPHLMRAKEMAPDGAKLVVTRYRPEQGISETFRKIVKRAGLTIWPKPMQNLRATRETELIALYPIKDVSSWLGNSAPIAMKHYAMQMKSSFDRAVQHGAGVAVRNPPQNPPHFAATEGNFQQQEESGNFQEPNENRGESPSVVLSGVRRSTEGGTRTLTGLLQLDFESSASANSATSASSENVDEPVGDLTKIVSRGECLREEDVPGSIETRIMSEASRSRKTGSGDLCGRPAIDFAHRNH